MIIEQGKIFSEEARELYLKNGIPILYQAPSAIEFLRYVAKRQPFLIKNGCTGWPAFSKWKTNDGFKECIGHASADVSIVPDGLADAIKQIEEGQRVFALPYEKFMRLSDAIDIMQTETPMVYYFQSQDDNLKDLPGIQEGVPEEIPWASEAFDQSPDAVNVWIGTHRSITSLHKDNYENIYSVIRGKKIFYLYPLIDTLFMDYEEYQVYKYDQNLQLQPQNFTTHWCEASPDAPEPIVVEVKAGDILYLPSLFYHMVTQEEDVNGLCVAVNYWYEMNYVETWSVMNLLKSLREMDRLEDQSST